MNFYRISLIFMNKDYLRNCYLVMSIGPTWISDTTQSTSSLAANLPLEPALTTSNLFMRERKYPSTKLSMPTTRSLVSGFVWHCITVKELMPCRISRTVLSRPTCLICAPRVSFSMGTMPERRGVAERKKKFASQEKGAPKNLVSNKGAVKFAHFKAVKYHNACHCRQDSHASE
eukprot:Gregarina_sp_Poly_1__2355@NODE_162_length_12261_cov_105_116123_g144_i0_p8_GENE_NODE_162_length_12261_cov_105_116123_g144_i0NODE_162_length_12261_cov_105_116123_g144_i0_p8_ORF_typecomplete_len174_score7_50_NODE_162_length_12261_cov_105_116123_g144_i01157612097